MNAIYNEIDPYACAWLGNLIERGSVAPGRVESRSIADLTPADVAGPGQRHFFAGIGGWSLALRLAGIPDDADVWTGSCPCQPFSAAGKRSGTSDPRHLWPAWFALIRECRPPVIFGEQVASSDGLAWLDLVYADLERCGYAVGAADLCAAGVGAPHIRQRLYFVAHTRGERREGQRLRVQPGQSRQRRPETGGAARLVGDSCGAGGRRHTGGLPDAQAQGESERCGARRVADEPVDAGAADVVGRAEEGGQRARRTSRGQRERSLEPGRSGADGAVADGIGPGRAWSATGGERARSDDARRNSADDPWAEVEWLPCLDGKARPVEPGLEPLAHGVSGRMVVRRAVEQADASVQEEEHWYNRVGALAGFGNAIVPQLAATFIEAAIAAIGAVT